MIACIFPISDVSPQARWGSSNEGRRLPCLNFARQTEGVFVRPQRYEYRKWEVHGMGSMK